MDPHRSGSWARLVSKNSLSSWSSCWSIFGAKKLKTIGSDLGSAVRGFKKSMNDGDTEESVKQLKADAEFPDSAKTQNAEKSEHKV